MVLINDKKYACEKCIKGHRVTGCTHTDRPLYEVAKKGRPTTQCQHCKEKRKNSGSSVHTKCACGDSKIQPPAPAVVQATSTSTEYASSSSQPSASADGPSAEGEVSPAVVEVETRKGQPGSRATFPRGLKDVHELAAAANALAGMGDDDGVIKVAERKVQALLNPCRCQTGGPCKCCHPKKNDRSDPFADHSSSVFSNHLSISTEASPSGGCCSSLSPASYSRPSSSQAHMNPYLSPENMHHPAHTSPHVHKTKLFSPYSTNPNAQSRHGRRDTIGSSKGLDRSSPTGRSLRPPPPRIRPLTDMARLIGAAINQDGSLASEIPRSAVGLPKLPGIATFDAAAENGGVKVEPIPTEDVDMPLAFPTLEDVVIGACMCGEDCACPGCATHDTGTPSPGHTHDGSCGEGCKGHHDCSHSMTVPSGVVSIAQLISLAASNVPTPPSDIARSTDLDPHDTRVLPPAVGWSEDVARTMGIIQLKPLECCNGRCQCAPGQCTCEKECCGCCIRCACAEEDEDAKMGGDEQQPEQTAQTSSCCSGKGSTAPVPSSSRQPSPLPSPTHLSPIGANMPSTMPPQPSPTLLSPEHARTPSLSSSSSRQPSPLPPSPNPAGFDASFSFPVPHQHQSSHETSATALRRATSTSAKRTSTSTAAALDSNPQAAGPSGRRATVTGNPPTLAASSKSAAKAVAPYSTTQHRAILPKPPSQSGNLLTVNTAVPSAGSRQSSPGAIRHSRSSSSAGPTRSGSPTGVERRVSASSVSRGRSSSNVQQPSQTEPVFLQPQPQPQPQPSRSAQSINQLAGFSWPEAAQFPVAANNSLAPPFVIETPSSPSQPPSQLQGSSQGSYQNLPHLQIPSDFTLSQPVTPDGGFDPRLGMGTQNAEIAAFLNQWSSLNPSPVTAQHQNQTQGPAQQNSSLETPLEPWHFPQQGGHRPVSSSSSSRVPGLRADMSGETSPEIDQPFDIEQFLNQALVNPSQSAQVAVSQYPRQGYQSLQQHPAELSARRPGSSSGTHFNPSFSDYFVNGGSDSQLGLSLPSSFQNADGHGLAPPGMRPDLSRNTSGSGFDLPHTPNTDESPVHPGLIPAFEPSSVYEPNWGHSKYPSNASSHDGGQAQAHNQAQGQVPASIALQGLNLDINALNGNGEKSDENIVDLSKPLDSAALQKIMRALQQQQQQNEEQQQQQQTPLAQVTPRPASDQTHSVPQSHSSQTHIQSQPQQTMQMPRNPFPPNDVINPSTNTRDLDDMFNQFVTLDGVGSGTNANPNANANGAVTTIAGTGRTDGLSQPSGFDMRMGLGMNSTMSGMPGIPGLGMGINMGNMELEQPMSWYDSQSQPQAQSQSQSQTLQNASSVGDGLSKDGPSWTSGNMPLHGMDWATSSGEEMNIDVNAGQRQGRGQAQPNWGI
ncbi:hypothetical protein IAU59_002181 [Kwoniella sp. CBS 9459]